MGIDQEGLNTPRDFVQAGWDYQKNLGSTWRNYTLEQLSRFNSIELTPITFDVPVDLQVDFGTFTRPDVPARPALPDTEVALPPAPPVADIPIPQIDAAPADPDFGNLTYVRPAAPNRPLPTRPDGTDPVLDTITVPDAPELDLPADPTLYALNLPEPPDIDIPQFLAQRPVRDFEAPGQTFSYVQAAYDRSTIDTIKARLGDIFTNGLGLPPEVEAAIFDRARGREDTLSLKAQQEAESAFAARGLRGHSGLFYRMLRRGLDANREATSAINRDLSIRAAEMAVEGIRFALAQGITLEASLLQSHNQENELALRAAQATQEVTIALYNARVALFAAEWEGFKAEAQVFGERVRALDAEVEIYAKQVDAQKAIGDVNESLVRAYAEKMRARTALVDIYRANIEAARARGELNTQRLEQQRLRLQAFGQDIDAWAKEQDAYRINVEAELGNIRALEAMGNIHNNRLNFWRTRNAAYFDQGRFRMEVEAQRLERFKAMLDGARTDSALKLARLDGVLRTYVTDAQIFTAQAQVSTAEAAAADRTASQRIEAARLRIETAQKNLELTANYAMKGVDAEIAVIRGRADIVAQLAASSQSGVNFAANYSGSLGYSFGRSASWSGEAGEGPDF